ncbi:unnamed protein product [Amoebophrya sp. A25]|nr:unnamed protein product [Amoebophrya sp. A25]|eukprot:GSA25T00008096001.1
MSLFSRRAALSAASVGFTTAFPYYGSQRTAYDLADDAQEVQDLQNGMMLEEERMEAAEAVAEQVAIEEALDDMLGVQDKRIESHFVNTASQSMLEADMTDRSWSNMGSEPLCMDTKTPIPNTPAPLYSMMTRDGRCGPSQGNQACKTGCCSQYAWCGDGHDWCDCNAGCDPRFGRCEANWHDYTLGENICAMPSHVNDAMKNLFQAQQDGQMYSSSSNTASLFDSEIADMHRAMPTATYEQFYNGFKCLKDEWPSLTLPQLQRMVVAVGTKAKIREVVHSSLILHEFADAVQLEYVWIWLLSLRSSFSQYQNVEITRVAIFLRYIRGHLCAEKVRSCDDVTLKASVDALQRVATHFPHDQLPDIDRAYTQMRLQWDGLGFFQFADAMGMFANALLQGNGAKLPPSQQTLTPQGAGSLLAPQGLTLSSAAQPGFAGLTSPIGGPQYVVPLDLIKSSLQELKTRTYLEGESIMVIIESLTSLFATGQPSSLPLFFSGLVELLDTFSLTKTQPVASLAPTISQAFAQTSAPFGEIASMLSKIRDLYPTDSRPTLPMCIELFTQFLAAHPREEPGDFRSILDTMRRDTPALATVGWGEGVANGDAATVFALEKELPQHFTRGGYPLVQSDIDSGVEQLIQAYGGPNEVQRMEVVSSLLRAGKRFGPLADFYNTVEALKPLASSGGGIFFGGAVRKFRLRTVVASLEVLSRFSDVAHQGSVGTTESRENGNLLANSPSTLVSTAVPLTTCAATMSAMQTELANDDELFAVSVDFASLKVGLADEVTLLDVWTTMSDIKKDLAPTESWRTVADSLHRLLTKFRRVTHLHHLHDMLADAKALYKITSLDDLLQPLVEFETEFVSFREQGSLEELMEFLLDLRGAERKIGIVNDKKLGTQETSLSAATHSIIELQPFAAKFAKPTEFFDALAEAVDYLEPAFRDSHLTFANMASSFARFHADFLHADVGGALKRGQEVSLHDLIHAMRRIHEYYPLSSLDATLTALGRLPGLFPEVTMHQLIEEVIELRQVDIALVVDELESYRKTAPRLTWETAKKIYIKKHPGSAFGDVGGSLFGGLFRLILWLFWFALYMGGGALVVFAMYMAMLRFVPGFMNGRSMPEMPDWQEFLRNGADLKKMAGALGASPLQASSPLSMEAGYGSFRTEDDFSLGTAGGAAPSVAMDHTTEFGGSLSGGSLKTSPADTAKNAVSTLYAMGAKAASAVSHVAVARGMRRRAPSDEPSVVAKSSLDDIEAGVIKSRNVADMRSPSDVRHPLQRAPSSSSNSSSDNSEAGLLSAMNNAAAAPSQLVDPFAPSASMPDPFAPSAVGSFGDMDFGHGPDFSRTGLESSAPSWNTEKDMTPTQDAGKRGGFDDVFELDDILS